jgi:hypothetical protein
MRDGEVAPNNRECELMHERLKQTAFATDAAETLGRR